MFEPKKCERRFLLTDGLPFSSVFVLVCDVYMVLAIRKGTSAKAIWNDGIS